MIAPWILHTGPRSLGDPICLAFDNPYWRHELLERVSIGHRRGRANHGRDKRLLVLAPKRHSGAFVKLALGRGFKASPKSIDFKLRLCFKLEADGLVGVTF